MSWNPEISGNIDAKDAVLEGKSMLARTQTGSLVEINKEGNRRILISNPTPTLREICKRLATGDYGGTGPYLPKGVCGNEHPIEHFLKLFLRSAAYPLLHDSDGTHWGISIEQANEVWVWMSVPGESMKPYSVVQGSPGMSPILLTREGSNLVLYGRNDARQYFSCSPTSGSKVKWRMLQQAPVWIGELWNAPLLKEGRIAEISGDGKILFQNLGDGTQKRWTLPGKGESARGERYVPALYLPDGAAFALPVLTEANRETIALCKPDSTVQFPWDRVWMIEEHEEKGFRRTALPGGGVAWESRADGTVLVIGPDGTAYPPLNMDVISEQFPIKRGMPKYVAVRRLAGSSLWFLFQHRILAEVDLNQGRILKSYPLDSSPNCCYTYRPFTREGVYYRGHERMLLIDWSGEIRDLGPAEM